MDWKEIFAMPKASSNSWISLGLARSKRLTFYATTGRYGLWYQMR